MKKQRSGWRYGIIRKTRRVGKKTIHWYDVHEIYDFDKKLSWTDDPVTVNGSDDLNGLRRGLSMMLADSFQVPVYEIRKGKLVARVSETSKENNGSR